MELLKNIYKNWCKIDDKIRFLIVGAINAGISYIIYALLLLIIGKEFYQICIAGQWILSSPISYLNQKFFVFCTKDNYIEEYFKCCSTWSLSYFLNALVIELVLKFIKNEYIAQFISLFIVSVVTYVLFKYFAFRKNRNNT